MMKKFMLLIAALIMSSVQLEGQPLALSRAVLNAPACGTAGNTSLSLTATGGSPVTPGVYTYTLFDGSGTSIVAGPTTGSTAQFTNLPPGSLTYKIEDGNGGVIGPVPGQTSFQLTNSPVSIVLTFFSNSVVVSSPDSFSFPAGNLPSVILDGTTQFPPIPSSPFLQTIQLLPGTHTIVGNLFCPFQSTFTFAFTTPAAAIASPVYMQRAQMTPAPCNDSARVTVQFTGAGGSGSYMYELQLPTGGTVTNTTGLFTFDATGTEGSLPFTIIDANNELNRTVNQSIRIIRSDFSYDIAITPPCVTGTGEICVRGTGATAGSFVHVTSTVPQYDATQSLAGGSFILNLPGIIANPPTLTYQVAINGECGDSNFVNFTVPLLSVIDFTATASSICGGNSSITVSNVTGGNGSYLYSIDGTVFCPNPVFTGLTAGQTYTVSVTDVNCAAALDPNGCTRTLNPDACIATKSVTIPEAPVIIINSIVITPPAAGSQFGSVSFIPDGGSGLFIQACAQSITNGTLVCLNAPSGAPFLAGQPITLALLPGTYTILVTDTNSCTGNVTNIIVPEVTRPLAFEVFGDALFRQNVEIDKDINVAGTVAATTVTANTVSGQNITATQNLRFINNFASQAILTSAGQADFGSIVVLSPDEDRKVEISTEFEQLTVAGVVVDSDPASPIITIAAGGEFLVKVVGPVHRGDRLVTSATAGVATTSGGGVGAFAIATSQDLNPGVKLVFARYIVADPN